MTNLGNIINFSNTYRNPSRHGPGLGLRNALTGTVRIALGLPCTWHARAGQRRALERLDPRLLDDVGIDAAAARREAGKPFWRP
ncbi:MAG: DUF1127 domain-containing protein [Alphaproteobacteria bacterium]|nr:DUF1127 domain-containing protein [Alphaproteobacteria bacterium]